MARTIRINGRKTEWDDIINWGEEQDKTHPSQSKGRYDYNPELAAFPRAKKSFTLLRGDNSHELTIFSHPWSSPWNPPSSDFAPANPEDDPWSCPWLSPHLAPLDESGLYVWLAHFRNAHAANLKEIRAVRSPSSPAKWCFTLDVAVFEIPGYDRWELPITLEPRNYEGRTRDSLMLERTFRMLQGMSYKNLGINELVPKALAQLDAVKKAVTEYSKQTSAYVQPPDKRTIAENLSVLYDRTKGTPEQRWYNIAKQAVALAEKGTEGSGIKWLLPRTASDIRKKIRNGKSEDEIVTQTAANLRKQLERFRKRDRKTTQLPE